MRSSSFNYKKCAPVSFAAVALLFALFLTVPQARAEGQCAASTASVSEWDCGPNYNPPGAPQLCVAQIYCNNGRTGEVRKSVESTNFIAQIGPENSTGRTFDPNCGRAVDAYCY